MSEIKDKYQESLEEEPLALSKKVELKKEDFSDSKEREILKSERKLTEEKQEVKKPRIEIIEEPEIIQERSKEPEESVEKEITPTTSASKLSSKIKNKIKELKELDRESQIKELCKLSFSENLDFAVNVAKGLDDAYVLDEFHDTLVDELYDKLVEEDKLKKI